MSPNLVLIVTAAVLVACGVTLVLERSLSRILVGFIMLSNGLNIMFLVASGPAGAPPIIGTPGGAMSDPLPQAMALTAIVITLGVSAFGLALVYRTHQLAGTDEVQDDVEDANIRRRAERDEVSTTFDSPDEGLPDEDGADEDGADEDGADEEGADV